MFQEHYAHEAGEMELFIFLSSYPVSPMGRTLNGKSKVLYLPITAVPGTLPYPRLQVKEISVVNETSPPKRKPSRTNPEQFTSLLKTQHPQVFNVHTWALHRLKGFSAVMQGKRSVHVFSQSYVEAFIQ